MRALAVFGLIGTLFFWSAGTSLGASPVQRCWYGAILAYLNCASGQTLSGVYLSREGNNPDPASPSGGSRGGTTGKNTGRSTGGTTGGGTGNGTGGTTAGDTGNSIGGTTAGGTQTSDTDKHGKGSKEGKGGKEGKGDKEDKGDKEGKGDKDRDGHGQDGD